jgi:DNA polymerase (family 10)
MLEDLRSQVPAGVMALLRIPGLGPKKAAALHKELGIRSLDMLRDACQADEVSKLKGFGQKTQEKILSGIDFAAQAHVRMYWAEADERPAATAAAGRRSAIWMCWSTRKMPTP